MSESEIRRLEDRIEAVNQQSQLRLDASMARIEGQIGRIAENVAAVRTELHEQRADGRSLREEALSSGKLLRDEIREELEKTRTEAAGHFRWLIGIIVAGGFGLAGLLLGVRQIWTAGVQTGQIIQSAPNTTPPMTSGTLPSVPKKSGS